VRDAARNAARLLGTRVGAGAAERMAWERWGPLVVALPGIERWPAGDRRALAAIVRAKWGGRESDFVRLSNRHARFRRALLALAR
jgi:hypothetical protein